VEATVKRLHIVAGLSIALGACEFDIVPEPGGATGSDDPSSEFTLPWETPGSKTTTGGTGSTAAATKCSKPPYNGQVTLNGTAPVPPAAIGACQIANLLVTGLATNAQLEQFASLEQVGSVQVQNTSQLTTLNGLRGLKVVQGILTIQNNVALGSIAGLNNLITVQEGFIVSSNKVLASVNGPPLSQSANINGIVFENNQALTSVSGFAGLPQMSSDLVFRGNSKLTSVVGFNALTTMTGTVMLDNCSSIQSFWLIALQNAQAVQAVTMPKLTSLSFPQLQTLQYINIMGFDALTNLDGFPKVGNVKNVNICNCKSLPAEKKEAFMNKHNATATIPATTERPPPTNRRQQEPG
jgi:hypothetical protein